MSVNQLDAYESGGTRNLRFEGVGYRRTTTFQNAVNATSNGTVMDVSELATVNCDVSGTFSATINFEVSDDDSVWYPIIAEKIDTGAKATTATATGSYRIRVAGYKSLRARVVWTSGTSVTVKGYGTVLQAPADSIQLAGRKTEEVILADAVAITDTTTHVSSYITLAGESLNLIAINTLDQDINIWFEENRGGAKALLKLDGSSKDSLIIKKHGAGYIQHIDGQDYRNLRLSLTGSYRLDYSCSVAPTTGAVTFILVKRAS